MASNSDSVAQYLERDRQVISPSYPRAYPFVMDHGAGSEVWDVDGKRYIDFASGIAVCSTGHSHPDVVAAITEQAQKFIHISSDYYHPIWIEFSEKLSSIAPFEESAKVFLCNSGTESVEAAIKLARFHTGRSQIIGFYGAFHGRTLGSLSVTARKPVYRRGFTPLAGGVHHAHFPNTYRPMFGDNVENLGRDSVDYIEEVLLGSVVPAEDCAAIIVEPVQGEGGYLVPPDDFFPALRDLCDRHGILLIADEVQSGVGRTGKWWAIEHWDIEPDIVCSAKGLASGMPLGAIIARESVMTWPQGAHGNTYGGNPLACAAGLATINLIENGMMNNAAEMGYYAMDALTEIQSSQPLLGDVRGLGLMIGAEFIVDELSKEAAPEMREAIVQRAFENGLLLLGAGKSTIRLAPPLNISENILDEGLQILKQSTLEVLEG